jgi:hypothetical protein
MMESKDKQMVHIKTYFIPFASGIDNLYAITAFNETGNISEKDKESYINCEWYYINNNNANAKHEVYKGNLQFPKKIYDTEPDFLFDALKMNCRLEIFKNIVLPSLDNLVNFLLAYQIKYDFSSFDLIEADKSILIFANTIYKEKLDKIKNETQIEELIIFIDLINKYKHTPGTILE